MPPVLSVAAFAARLAESFALHEEMGGSGGVAAVVDLTDISEAPPPGSDRAVHSVPGVIVGVANGTLKPAATAWGALMDVVVRGESDLDRLVTGIEARPLAASALVLLLRGGEGRTVEDGLVTESSVYSLLQAGPEFAAWRQTRPAPGPARGEGGGGNGPVLLVRDGDRLTVTLSRPAVHNAFNTAMRDALVEALTVAITDPAVSVVLQGAGRSFCSGGDLGDFGTAPDPATSHLIRLTRSPAACMARLASRLSAHLHGACIGAGVELAAFAGRVVAHPDTFFALPELNLGLIPGAGGTVSLPRRIGRHRTAWLALTGERIGAERALRWGLVDAIA